MPDEENRIGPPATSVPEWPILQIPCVDIREGNRPRLRKTSDEQVKQIKESLLLLGLLHPITVAADDDVQRSDPPRPRYELLAGANRLAACRGLGWTTITAKVVTMPDGPRRQLYQVDENLCGTHLKPAQRKDFLLERKRLYELLYPETKKGNAQAEGKRRSAGKASECQSGIEVSECQSGTEKRDSFVEDTAKKTGLSKRTIHRAVSTSKPKTKSAAGGDYPLGDVQRLEPNSRPAKPTEVVPTYQGGNGAMELLRRAKEAFDALTDPDDREQFITKITIYFGKELDEHFGNDIDELADERLEELTKERIDELTDKRLDDLAQAAPAGAEDGARPQPGLEAAA